MGNEDTIKEFTLVLVANFANLADSSTGLRKEMVVNTIEDKFILDVLREIDGAALVELDQVRFLTTQEVLDFNLLLILGDDGSDGEMCMNKSHLVAETLSDSNDHVANVGFDGGDGTSLSVTSIPHLDAGMFALQLGGLHIHDLDVEGNVGEVFGDSSSVSLNGDLSGFAGNSD